MSDIESRLLRLEQYCGLAEDGDAPEASGGDRKIDADGWRHDLPPRPNGAFDSRGAIVAKNCDVQVRLLFFGGRWTSATGATWRPEDIAEAGWRYLAPIPADEGPTWEPRKADDARVAELEAEVERLRAQIGVVMVERNSALRALHDVRIAASDALGYE
jgi:hypothetical protein